MNISQLCMGCMADKGTASICPQCGWQEGTQPEVPQHLPPRTILNNRYVLGRVLGQGGFGITYLAWDMTLNTRLAIKEYLPQTMATRYAGETQVNAYSSDGAQEQFRYGLDRFLEEARVLARFSDNPHIVAVRDYFESNGTGYLVMAYLDGITFKSYLAGKGNRIPYEEALRIMVPVMEALEEVHQVGLLHRDISPDNIYITRNNQVKVLDFGAARYALGDRSKSLSIILKAGYAPEEQYRSKGVQGAWTDVYATAATLYRAITGVVPPEALDRGVEDTIVLPSRMGVNIPPAAEAALLKALAVYAQYRYQSMSEFREALMSISPVTQAPPSGYSSLEKTQAVSPSAMGPAAVQSAYDPGATAPAGAYAGYQIPPQQAGYQQSPYPGPVQAHYPPAGPARKKKWPWVVGGIALVLIVLFIGGLALIGAFINSTESQEARAIEHSHLDSAPIIDHTTPSGVSFESITTCQGVDEEKVKPVNPTSTFSSTAGTIYVYAVLSGPPQGSVTANWYIMDPAAGPQFYSTYTVEGGGTSDVFYFWISSQSFTTGQWEVDVLLEDGTYATASFTVVP